MAEPGKAPLSSKDDLANLAARATSEYAHKRYAAAAELYSEAVELQDTINGEMAPENADLLYSYGRCLYHAAVQSSEVLGGKMEDAAKSGANTGNKKRKAEQDEGESRKKAKKEDGKAEENANLEFGGDDEEWEEDSEDEEDDANAGAEGEEEDDDFAIAYEVLETARVLFERRLKAATSDDSSENGEGALARNLKETLADIHDLQAETHLENEQFTAAVEDSRATLKLKTEIYPFESNFVAEAHYKLSLALEFASKTQVPQSTVGQEGTGASSSAAAAAAAEPAAQIDEEVRKEAAEHMEQAVNSSKKRIQMEEESLASMQAECKDVEEKKLGIADTKELIEQMEERVRPFASLYEKSC